VEVVPTIVFDASNFMPFGMVPVITAAAAGVVHAIKTAAKPL
jgi:hypothetical protein